MEESKLKVRRKKVRIMQALAGGLVVLLLLTVQDFVQDLMKRGDRFEIRFEEPYGMTNGQQVYKLYRNDEHVCDVDFNEFNLLDENGNTDYWYCLMIQDARNLSYAIILCLMLFVVIVIVNDTVDGSPFTHRNANRIRLIGVLQFALAIVPALVAFTMKFVKFMYSSTRLEWTGFYMFIIGFAIMTLAQVFDYGVRLQEDVDSIA